MAKLSRYGPDILTELFDENSNVNRVDQGARECGICHISTDQLSSYKGNRPNAGTDIQACEVCNGLYDLGKALIDDKKKCLCCSFRKSGRVGQSNADFRVFRFMLAYSSFSG